MITDLLINEIDKYYKNLEKDNEVLILEGVRKTYLEEKPGFFAVFNNKGNYIINKKIMEAWIDYLTGDIDVNELEIEIEKEIENKSNVDYDWFLHEYLLEKVDEIRKNILKELSLAYEEKRLTNEEKEIYEKIKSLLERKAIA